MTDAELRLHRQVVKRIDPSLPQRAGRAYAKLERGEWKCIDHTLTPKGRAITVRSVVKPKPDMHRLVKAAMAIAMEEHGLTPSWARPQLDPVSSKRGSDGRVGDAVADTKPRE
jgi:hypothetical protein